MNKGKKIWTERKTAIMLSQKIMFKICVSKLQQQSIGENSLSPPTLKQASRLSRNLYILSFLLQKLFY